MTSTSKNGIVQLMGRCFRMWPVNVLLRGFYHRRNTIVFYHGVWPSGSQKSVLFKGTSLGRLEADLRILRRFFRFASLEYMLYVQEAGASSEKPELVVTFDDGFDLTDSGATDLLESFGIRATTFVNTASVDYTRLMWQHGLAAIRELRGDETFVRELNGLLAKTGCDDGIHKAEEQIWVTRLWPMERKDEYAESLWKACDMPPLGEFLEEHRPYFDWGGLEEWLRRGHTVGFHTDSHPFCSRLREADVVPEIVAPAMRLRERLRLQTIPFAYPFGERLVAEQEARVIDLELFSCLFSTGELSPPATAPQRLSRVEGEGGVDREVFGRPVMRAFRAGGHAWKRSSARDGEESDGRLCSAWEAPKAE